MSDLESWLVASLCDGTLVPERGYGRRELRQRLTQLRPETGVVDHQAVIAALEGRGTLRGVEVRASGGRRVALALGPAFRGRLTIHQGDNLPILEGMADGSVDLVYIDPPFNTGVLQARTRIKTSRDDEGDRVGFRGERYRSVRLGTHSFADAFDDYLGFLAPRLEHAYRLLGPEGSLFLHLDYREVHYAKVLLDQIFGRASFINEIIWAYDYGGRTTKRWPAKHDNILWYARNPRRYCFNYDAIDRIPYLAPALVGATKAARGKTPTDTWWHTIVSPGGREKNGYPTQKPLGILNRLVRVHTRPGDAVLDFFAGSGSIGESAAMHGRHAILIDRNPEAITVMRERLARFEPTMIGVDEAPEVAERGEVERPALRPAVSERGPQSAGERGEGVGEGGSTGVETEESEARVDARPQEATRSEPIVTGGAPEQGLVPPGSAAAAEASPDSGGRGSAPGRSSDADTEAEPDTDPDPDSDSDEA